MAMLKLPIAITKGAIIAMLAISAIWHGHAMYPVKEHTKTSSMVLNSYQSDIPFRHYKFCGDFIIFTSFLQCKNVRSLRQISQKLVHPMT